MSKTRAHVIVEGRVQGVFFRAETHQTALEFSVTGWVRNLPDGRVEAVLEGKSADVEKMIAWCRQGPPHAVVKKIDIHREEYRGEFDTFSITY